MAKNADVEVAQRVVGDVACPGCGCVCDDLTLRFAGEQLVEVSPRCELAERWFLENARTDRPAATVSGKACSLEQALARAAELLSAADYPLVFGLSRSAAPGQRAAVELAERLGGAIDTAASLTHAPATFAMQEFGEVGCTLGEVRNRADLVIFWGCNPAESHPRHAERYSVFAKGSRLPQGRNDRTVVMVGPADEVEHWRLDASGATPDHLVSLETGGDFEAIAHLRQALRTGDTASPPQHLAQLFDQMKSCQTGVVFYGIGEAECSAAAAGLLQLVAEMNAHTRFFARRMRRTGDAPGGDQVLAWQTGYPFAVDFSRGFPRHNGLEFSANELLARGEVDACLLIGSQSIEGFSPAAHEHLERIPTIALDPPGAVSSFRASVSITTAAYGLHAAGLIFRMDGVPLHLQKVVDSAYPTDEYVLHALQEQINAKR